MPATPGAANEPPRVDVIVTRFVPLQLKGRGVELRLVIPGAHPQLPKVDLALLRAVGRARRWFDQLAAPRQSSLFASSDLIVADHSWPRGSRHRSPKLRRKKGSGCATSDASFGWPSWPRRSSS